MKADLTMKACVALLLWMGSVGASAQQVLKVSQSVWLALSPPEREYIQKTHVVDLTEPTSFGVIIDNQGVDESTSGTRGGANLGSAIGNATYIDRAIRNNNYSARSQLASGILGGIVGSALDSAPKAQYHYRYAVRLGTGDVNYFDETKGDPFRHPVGVCISVPNIALVTQQLCSQTVASLRATYLGGQPTSTMVTPPSPPPDTTGLSNSVEEKVAPDSNASTGLINCKRGNLAPVRTSPEKCELIKGSQVP